MTVAHFGLWPLVWVECDPQKRNHISAFYSSVLDEGSTALGPPWANAIAIVSISISVTFAVAIAVAVAVAVVVLILMTSLGF